MPRRRISKVLLLLLLLLLLLVVFQIVQLRVSLVFHLTHKMFLLLLLLLNSSLQLQFALLFSCVRRVSVRQHTTQFVSVSVAAFTFCVLRMTLRSAFCARALHVLDWLRSPSCSAFCCLRCALPLSRLGTVRVDSALSVASAERKLTLLRSIRCYTLSLADSCSLCSRAL